MDYFEELRKYYTIYQQDLLLEKELNEAAPFLRGKLAKVLEIRNIPELKFIYDTSIEYAQNIENIIKEINEE